MRQFLISGNLRVDSTINAFAGITKYFNATKIGNQPNKPTIDLTDSNNSITTQFSNQGWKLLSSDTGYSEQLPYLWSVSLIETASNITVSDEVVQEGYWGQNGKDAISVEIWSTNGNIFKSKEIRATLSCHVIKGGKDITDTIDAEYFTWSKADKDGNIDSNWSKTGTKTIEITANDILSRAVFTCTVDSTVTNNN